MNMKFCFALISTIILYTSTNCHGNTSSISNINDPESKSLEPIQLSDLSKAHAEVKNIVLDHEPPSSDQKKYTSKEFGSTAPLLNVIQDFVEFSNKESENFNLALEETRMNEMFSLESFCNIEMIKDSIERLAICKRKISDIEITRDQKLKEIDSKINSLSFASPKEKMAFLNGYNTAKNKSIALTTDYFRIKKDIVNEFQNFFKFLLTVQGDFFIEDGEIVFDSIEHMNEFNSRFSKINELMDQEEIIEDKLNSQFNQHFKT